MAWKPGQSGNSRGRASEKPFADALRMEIASAGGDHKVLRAIARNLLTLAQEPVKEALPAINQVADRLDGKPAQESTVTFDDKRDATDWTRDELVALINDARTSGNGAAKANGRSREPDSVH